jgi:hypothetical protein
MDKHLVIFNRITLAVIIISVILGIIAMIYDKYYCPIPILHPEIAESDIKNYDDYIYYYYRAHVPVRDVEDELISLLRLRFGKNVEYKRDTIHSRIYYKIPKEK